MLAIGAAVVLAGVVATFAFSERFSARVPRAVHVLDADLSGLGGATAQGKIESVAATWLARKLVCVVDARATTVEASDAGFAIDAPETAARAAKLDRDRGFLSHFGAWLTRLRRPAQLPPAVRVDAARLEAALDRVERDLVELPEGGGIRLDGERFVSQPPRAGRRIDRAAARRALRAAVETGSDRVLLTAASVPAPIAIESVERVAERANALARAQVVLTDPASTRALTFEPTELRQVLAAVPARDGRSLELGVDAAALERVIAPRRATIESAPVSARFSVDAKDRVEIVPSQPAARIDMRLLADAVLTAAAAPDRRGSLPFAVSSEQPALTTEQAQGLGIRRLLSTFTTRHPCCERRVENIHRIADLLDGLVVKPGETVSVNAVVGPRTTKNGFVLAPTIEEGEMVDSVGGGISQFATTLFNALFYGGFDIIERQPHTYWFPRYPMGHEATLSYPKPDVVFRNDTDFGMLLDTAYTKTSITVRIFGDNGGRKVQAQVSARQNVVEPPVEILGNPEVLPDEERVREAGMIGWSVIVGRILTLPDGTKKEERRKVTYRPRTRRVEVHPCRVPKGEKGYTGERCPEPQDSGEIAAAPELEPTPGP